MMPSCANPSISAARSIMVLEALVGVHEVAQQFEKAYKFVLPEPMAPMISAREKQFPTISSSCDTPP